MAELDPYSAYSNSKQNTPMDVAVGIATLPYNPAYYMSNPLLWNTKKGLYVPFATSAKAYTAESNAIRTAFGKGGVGGIGQAGKSALKLFTPFGGGGRWFGQDMMNPAIIKNKERWKKIERSSEIQNILKQKVDKQTKRINRNFKKYSKNEFGFELANEKLEKLQSKHSKFSIAAEKQFNNLAPKIEKSEKLISSLTKGAKFAKVGMRLGRAASWVGAISLTWDLMKMVGEPLGRAMVSEVSSASQRWSERYMPELGGQLSLAYLTRGAATDRQRALMAMSKSGITGRSALGQEAKFSHS